ncbi:MAG TPA: peptidoglycan DD-metalloendopeptidase family protein [Acetobacteraceae bacterium]
MSRAAGLLAILLATTGAAPPTQRQLQDAEQSRAEQLAAQRDAAARAAAAQAQEQVLAAQRVAAAAKLRDAEMATADAAARVAALAQRRQAAQARLAASAAAMGPLLPLIERLALYPAETLLAVPRPPEDAIRGVLVLGGITRQLESDAAALRAEQAEIDSLQTQIDAEMPSLNAAQAAQAQEEVALDDQIAATQGTRRAAEDAGAAASRQAAIEASRADSLRSALARIEADRRAAEARAKAEADAAERQRHDAEAQAARQREEALAKPAGAGIGAPRGLLTVPVAGTVLHGFGETTDAGPSTGVSYVSAPEARVVSPCGGRIVFAGPFRSFGLLLIVDCGGGYHFVLAGFQRLDAQVGQSVQPGEPVGIMPNWDPRASATRPSLYVELRQNGQPVNPAPFLRAKG